MKIQYKNLQKKQSVLKLITDYGKSILACFTLAICGIVIGIGGYFVSKYEDTTFLIGVIDFVILGCGVVIIAVLVFMIAIFLWRCITYVRAFFRYAYLPLTVKEACMVKMDLSPVTFFKVLKSMMCYDYDFGEKRVVFRNIETENKLMHLFYQLFFYKTDCSAR